MELPKHIGNWDEFKTNLIGMIRTVRRETMPISDHGDIPALYDCQNWIEQDVQTLIDIVDKSLN